MFGSGTRNQGKGSQQHQHNHHQPLSSIASQTSLPELLAHGQQRTKGAESFAKLTSRISVQATPALWEPMFVPWWFVIAAMFAA